MTASLWRRGTRKYSTYLLPGAIVLHSFLIFCLYNSFSAKDRISQHAAWTNGLSRDMSGAAHFQRSVPDEYVVSSPLLEEGFRAPLLAERSQERPSTFRESSPITLSFLERQQPAPFTPQHLRRAGASPEHREDAAVILEDSISARVSPASKVAVLILFYRNGGSSLLGEMFDQHPDFFYMFEPLHSLEHAARGGDPTSQKQIESLAVRILNSILSCDFSGLGNHFKSYFQDKGFGGWQKSDDLRQVCSISKMYFTSSIDNKNICPIMEEDIPNVLRAICVRRKHAAMTSSVVDNIGTLVNLLRERETPSPERVYNGGLSEEDERLLQEEDLRPVPDRNRHTAAGITPDLPDSLRLLLVVLDPRTWVTSRLQQLHVNASQFQVDHVTTAGVRAYCDWVLNNTRPVPSLSKGLEGRFAVLRHEDVVTRPLEMVRKVYRFIGAPLHSRVLEWLQQYIRNESMPLDMINGKVFVGSWQTKLTFTAINKIQEVASCRKVMSTFGYRLFVT